MHLLVLNFFVKCIERITVSEKDRLVIWAGAVDFVGMVRSGFFANQICAFITRLKILKRILRYQSYEKNNKDLREINDLQKKR